METVDTEIQTIQEIYVMLNRHNADSIKRILTWLNDKFDSKFKNFKEIDNERRSV